MRIQVRNPSDLPKADTAAHDAEKSRRGRTAVGICLTLIGLAWALVLAAMYGTNGPYIATLGENEIIGLILADAQNAFFAIALIIGGIWNITARRSNSKAPLIAALGLSGLALILDLISIVEVVTAAATATTPNVVGVLFHVGIFVQTIRLLKLNPINPLLLPIS